MKMIDAKYPYPDIFLPKYLFRPKAGLVGKKWPNPPDWGVGGWFGVKKGSTTMVRRRATTQFWAAFLQLEGPSYPECDVTTERGC